MPGSRRGPGTEEEKARKPSEILHSSPAALPTAEHDVPRTQFTGALHEQRRRAVHLVVPPLTTSGGCRPTAHLRSSPPHGPTAHGKEAPGWDKSTSFTWTPSRSANVVARSGSTCTRRTASAPAGARSSAGPGATKRSTEIRACRGALPRAAAPGTGLHILTVLDGTNF